MVTKVERTVHNNLAYKYEKNKAKVDFLEQEIQEKDKIIEQLKRELERQKMQNEKEKNEAKENYNKLYNDIAKINKEVADFKNKKKEDEKIIRELRNKIEELEAAIKDFKASNMKNSTNSSKPSSTNGFKRVIQNNRVKSGKSKGGQIGRKGKTLKVVEKADKIIDVRAEEVCECGGKIIYNELQYIKRQVIDLINEIETIEYRYYVGICEKCGKEHMKKIPNEHNNPIQYSNKIKALVPVVKNIGNTSVETTRRIFGMLFKGIPFSTGWVHKQDKILAKKCKCVYEKIRKYLKTASIAHADETGVKIEDVLGCCIVFSDQKAVFYDMFKNKSKESFDEFEIFTQYMGILMHDHNKTYYKYSLIEHAECNVHICRYLEHVIQVSKREGAKKLKEFLMRLYAEKIDAITTGKKEFTEQRIKEIKKEYLQILEEWKNEYNKAIEKIKNLPQTLKEEKNLFSRLREFKEEHLRFVTNFKVPFSNNEAERNLRSIKLKINVSKRFGKIECAKNYAVIKTIIETAKKQGKDVLYVFNEILNDNYDVFDLNINNTVA